MTSIVDSSVIIQTSAESVPAPPSWLGEAVLLIEYLRKQAMLTKICERVQFARRRMGHYEVIDFLAMLAGLRDQRGAHARSVLRGGTALCAALHGAFRARALALPLGALALFGCPDSGAS